MHGNVPADAAKAISCRVQTVSKPPDTEEKSTFTDQTGSGENAWFVDLCKQILPKDAGLHLHYITGFPERTCYRYASGERGVSGEFFRALLRSPQGQPFLNAIMHGSDAAWWSDLQRKIRNADRVDGAGFE